jgi:hypothetical protein
LGIPILYPRFREGSMPNQPTASAKNVTGDFERFTEFARRVISVPHSTIKARLDAEKEAKRMSKTSVSRVSGASSKRAR